VARASSVQPRAGNPSLETYAGKRDFARTPEPKPEQVHEAGHAFVIQKHAARRLHYDLRLELDGVLKSWAVTRGPSLTVGEKRLAIQTEDHPIEYLDFEGNIPKGEYGGGTMIVWDRGRWLPEGDPHRGLSKGHLAFTLEGSRLKGLWHLVRLRPDPGKDPKAWLLIKSDDAFARSPGSSEITDEELTSFLSGRTTDELAAEGALRKDHVRRAVVQAKQTHSLPDVARIPGVRKGLLPVFVEPCLASPSDRPPNGPDWVHEIKYDGYRIQARIDGPNVRLLTRTKLDWTDRFESIADGLKELNLGSALIDGEIVVEDTNGIPSFNDLQADLKAGRQDRLRYHLFDIVYCNGFDLMRATLIDRKELLLKIVGEPPIAAGISFSGHLEQDGPTVFEHACRLGLEGIISKRRDVGYTPGRSGYWLKSKGIERQEFVIVGYIPSTAATGSVGSALLAYYQASKLLYAGRVGTGWSTTQAKELRDELETLRGSKPVFGKPLPVGAEKGVRWAEPKLVCDVQFRGWTHDGLLRQASFKGIREDKLAEDIILENPPKLSNKATTPDIAGIRLTHPERLLFEDGVSKQALAEFYTEIADWILPHISNRILTLVRCPSGVSSESFFAKHPWQGLSAAVRRVDVGEEQPMLAIDDLSGLISLVQSGVVEIHAWGSSVDHLDRADRIVFDLDPGEDVPWAAVIQGAINVRQRLADIGLKSFVKTTGGKGLHVVAPIEPQTDWNEVKAFTGAIAIAMARSLPDQYVSTLSKRARRGRIFVDYLRNGRGATAVAAYSTRARPRAPISTPLAWEELTEAVKSDHFNVDNLRQRLAYLKCDPWEGFFKLHQSIDLSPDK
jgi:bifunctional non-homologous end joining protein LigD